MNNSADDPIQVALELADEERVNQLADAFEREWKALRRPQIEQYLPRVSVVARTVLLLELVALEIDYLRRHGEEPDLESYRRRFPDPSGAVAVEAAFNVAGRDDLDLRAEAEALLKQHGLKRVDGAAEIATQNAESPETVDTGDSPRDDVERARHPKHQGMGNDSLQKRVGEGAVAEPFEPGKREVGSNPGERGITDKPVQFGDYILLGEIARGGMGVVYKARQTSLNRVVALKMILAGQFAGEDQISRFRIEAEAAAKLDHAHIVPIFEVGESDGTHFFSMGFVEGSSLDVLLREGPLPAQRAAELMRTIANAVHYAHQQGIIHRDLKPANVLLDGSGEPRVTDFGLAKDFQRDSGMTATGQVMGTPSYMPPEQAAGKASEVGTAADVYALGAMLYALLTGRPPFQAAGAVEVLRQVVEDEPVSPRRLNPSLSRDLETICLKCLQKSPAGRYASAAELADELGRYLDGRPIVARATSRAERLVRWCYRNPLVTGLSLAIGLSILVGSSVASYFGIHAMRTAGELSVSNGRLKQVVGELSQSLTKEAGARKQAQDAEGRERHQRELAEDSLYLERLRRAHREIGAGNLRAASDLLDECDVNRRGWEWRFLKGQSKPDHPSLDLGRLLESLTYSPDGRHLIAGHRDRASVWTAAGKHVKDLYATRSFGSCSAVFPPSGEMAAVLVQSPFDNVRPADRGRVLLVDSTTWRVVRTLRDNFTREAIAITFAGSRELCVVTRTHLVFYDTQSGRRKEQVKVGSPDRWRITKVTRGRDAPVIGLTTLFPGYRIELWDLGTRQQLFSRETTSSARIALNTYGTKLAYSLEENPYLVQILDRSGRLLERIRLDHHRDPNGTFAFTSDGQGLVTTDLTGQLHVVFDDSSARFAFDVSQEPGTRIGTVASRGDWLAVPFNSGKAFVLDRRRRTQWPLLGYFRVGTPDADAGMVTALIRGRFDSRIVTWSGRSGRRVHEKIINAPQLDEIDRDFWGRIIVGPKSGRVYYVTQKTIMAWDPETRTNHVVVKLDHREPLMLQCSPQEKWLGFTATIKTNSTTFSDLPPIANSNPNLIPSQVGIVELATGELRIFKHVGKHRMQRPHFSRNEQRMAIRMDDRGKDYYWVLNAASGGVLFKEPVTAKDMHSAAWLSPDGSTVYLGSSDRRLFAYDVASKKKVGELVGHESAVQAMAFLDAGRLALTGDRDGMVRLWMTRDCREVISWRNSQHPIGDILISSDERLAAITSGPKGRLGLGQVRVVRVDWPPQTSPRDDGSNSRALAHAAWQRRAWSEVVAQLTPLLERGQATSGDRFRHAQACRYLERWHDVLGDCDLLLSTATEATAYRIEAILLRAEALLALDHDTEGQTEFSRHIELQTATGDPVSGRAYVGRGRAYLEMEAFTEALADFGRLSKGQDGWSNELDWYRGECHLGLADWGQAEQHLARYLESNPDSKPAARSLLLARCALGRGTPEEAQWSAIVPVTPSDAVRRQFDRVAWAVALRRCQREEAVIAFRLAEHAGVELRSVALLPTKGALLFRLGRYSDAVSALSRTQRCLTARHIDQPKSETQGTETSADAQVLLTSTGYFLAMSHHRLGRTEEAARWLKSSELRAAETAPPKGSRGARLLAALAEETRASLQRREEGNDPPRAEQLPTLPADIPQLSERFLRSMNAGSLEETVRISERICEVQPEAARPFRFAAGAALRFDDREFHRKLCHQMLQRFGGTTDEKVAWIVVQACVALDKPETHLKAIVKLAEVPDSRPGNQLRKLGAAQSLAARYKESRATFVKVAQQSKWQTRDYLFMALAAHHTGQRALAVQYANTAYRMHRGRVAEAHEAAEWQAIAERLAALDTIYRTILNVPGN